jgi:hypothetical protein
MLEAAIPAVENRRSPDFSASPMINDHRDLADDVPWQQPVGSALHAVSTSGMNR